MPFKLNQPRNRLAGNIGLLYLGHGKYAIVDAEDFDRVKQYRWFLRKSHAVKYVCRNIRQGKTEIIIRLHRVIMYAPEFTEIHHWNHDPLDNRRSNLLVCTHTQHKLLHMSRIESCL